ncbi:hypothetical protein [Methylobacterium aquaticum]|uniref:Uncharacterized protein n=1 Tax=Methylobacterium aquaticum TaxID=270351 RepID=A0A0C6G0X6_9HYPH|nr:hypothetical protein [Methylobacterium aquaticum]BAQ49445.1 hypothetical protein Maq22A_1p36160 [Methylobacterium aquaticum]
MCHTCFLRDRAEFGAAEITPAVVEAARLAKEANPYGPLYLVVEQHSVEDASIAYCASRVGERWTEADRACLAAFQTLTEYERSHALASRDGYVDAAGAVMPDVLVGITMTAGELAAVGKVAAPGVAIGPDGEIVLALPAGEA